jgi:ubiquinone/menaquinone biosynthesis C-methylase UbiE
MGQVQAQVQSVEVGRALSIPHCAQQELAMVASDTAFTGSIPQLYDRFMVPMLFEPYARDLAQRIKSHGPRDVLETAAGTGVLTSALAQALPGATSLTATDLNEQMLAQAKPRLAGKPQVKWQQADALALPFDDASFDIVACQFGVMFFPDKIKGYSEARRVLRPGGRFLFNVWDKIEENDFPKVVQQALRQIFPNEPPQFLSRTPHGYHDLSRIRADLAAAGFNDIAIETVAHRSRASSPKDPAVAFCQGTPVRAEIEARGGPSIETVTQQVAEALARRFGNGAVEGRIQAFVISAVA